MGVTEVFTRDYPTSTLLVLGNRGIHCKNLWSQAIAIQYVKSCVKYILEPKSTFVDLESSSLLLQILATNVCNAFA